MTDRQRVGAALVVVSAVGAGGLWYGIDYYRDAADCNGDLVRQNAATTVLRTDLATQQNEAVNTLLNGVGELIVNPRTGDNSGQFKMLFQNFRATTDRVATERAANPIVPLPEGCK